jgi:predicted site-specific integrase-resolvase
MPPKGVGVMEGWTKIKGAANYAGISERSFRKWLKQGLQHIRMNTGTILIKYSWVDEFLESFEIQNNEVSRIVSEIEKEMEI